MCVPHVAQNSRVTGLGRSARVNPLGAAFVYLNHDAGRPITTFGLPPEMY